MNNKPHSSIAVRLRSAALLAVSTTVMLAGTVAVRAEGLVSFEAESASPLGSDFAQSNGSPTYITILTDSAAYNPGSAARVATYTVTFPEAGTYQLYARMYVGPGGYNDDSMFYATTFGNKSPSTDGDWVFVNGLAGVGFNNDADIVTGGGTLGSGVWKWLNLSQFTSQTGFTVAAGGLTQTFQIGARENGLNLDKFVFGTLGTALAVSNLDSGTLPASVELTNTFTGPDGNALHRFNPLVGGLNLDGANPAAGLALCGGVLCGTTLRGGVQGAGTAFAVTLDGTNFTAIRSFANQPDAGNAQGELAVTGVRFFGTTSGGGNSGGGTVFAGQNGGSVAVLHSFAAASADNATNSGGASPGAMLALSGGTLYGTATAGGAAANGTVFSLTTNGATFSVLHDFSLLDAQAGTNADGALPLGGLILAGGRLYGTASAGGAGGSGVIFAVDPGGANFTTLHSFAALDPETATNADGAMPLGGLAWSSNTLYGTTYTGGSGGRGTAFSIQTNGLGFTVLHHFAAVDAVARTNAEGASPCAALTFSSNVLYGTASAGGAGAAGTVFALSPDGTQFSTIHGFPPVAVNGTNADGAFPVAPVLRIGNTVYGTAFGGGPGGVGTVFSLPVPTSPAPPAIIRIGRNPNGTVTLQFQGGAESTNVIQVSPSLSPPAWQSVSTNVADPAGFWEFTDTNITATNTRFYRSYAR